MNIDENFGGKLMWRQTWFFDVFVFVEIMASDSTFDTVVPKTANCHPQKEERWLQRAQGSAARCMGVKASLGMAILWTVFPKTRFFGDNGYTLSPRKESILAASMALPAKTREFAISISTLIATLQNSNFAKNLGSQKEGNWNQVQCQQFLGRIAQQMIVIVPRLNHVPAHATLWR